MAHGDIRLDYELPAFLQSLKEAWLTSFQGAAVVVSSVSRSAAQFLSTIKGDSGLENTNSAAFTAMLVCTYSALILNSSATITSLILIANLGNVPVRAAQDPCTPKSHEEYPARPLHLLVRFGAGKSWKRLLWHWLLSFLLGIIFLMADVLLYIFVVENLVVKYTVLAIAIVSLLPMIYFIPFKLTP